MAFSTKISNSFFPLTIFGKSSALDLSLDSESAIVVKVKVRMRSEIDYLTTPRKSKLFFEIDVFISFHATAPLLHPLITLENQRFPVFMGLSKWSLSWNGIKVLMTLTKFVDLLLLSIFPEAALLRCSCKKVFWKYAANLK